MTLLDVEDVTMRFGGIVALDGLSFSIDESHICDVQRREPHLSTDARFGAIPW